jgi:hypothetical protein
METDARINLVAAKRKKFWRWPERLWCASLVAATLDVVEHHSFLGLPAVWALVGLMVVRILIAGVLCFRELYVGQ